MLHFDEMHINKFQFSAIAPFNDLKVTSDIVKILDEVMHSVLHFALKELLYQNLSSSRLPACHS